MSETRPWWDTIEPPAADLAKRIAAKRGYPPERVCLPYQAQMLDAPSGTVTLVDPNALVPVWTCFISLAREALATRDEQAVDTVTVPGLVTFTDPETQDDKWRRERGLDAEATEE